MNDNEIKLGLEDALENLRQQKTEVQIYNVPGFVSLGRHNIQDWKLDRAIAALEHLQKERESVPA